MKKILAVTLALSMLFAMTSCALMNRLMGGTQKNPVSDTNDETNGGWKEGEVYVISTVDELYQFVEDYNADRLPEQISVRLDADICVNDIADTYMNLTADHLGGYRMWTPITFFKGTFDGNGHTISGLVCCWDFENENTGLIWTSALMHVVHPGAVVKNLTVADSYFTTHKRHDVASICGLNLGEIENCVNYARVESANGHAGGIATKNAGIIRGCKNYGDVKRIAQDENCRVGGISANNRVSEIEGKEYIPEITECVNYGEVSGNASFSGGIVGENDHIIRKCINKGKVVGITAGGIAGESHCQDVDEAMITDSINKGTVEGREFAGGICARAWGTQDDHKIWKCTNYGSVVSGEKAAGICVNVTSLILECANMGAVTSTWSDVDMNAAAGICISDSNHSLIKYCFNSGVISAQGKAAGLCLSIEGEITCCYSAGEIESLGSSAFGLGGRIDFGMITDCYFIGELRGDDRSRRQVGESYGAEKDRVLRCKNTAVNQSIALNPAWYSAFEYEEIWQMDPHDVYPYPFLRNLPYDFTE